MSTTLTTPKENVPIGSVSVGGQSATVTLSPEYLRFFFDLVRRVGGTKAQTNTDLSTHMDEQDSEAAMSRSDLSAVEALRAVDELRNQFASLRNDCDQLRSQLADRDAELAGLRTVLDLRSRVEQLEDRNT